MGRDGGEEEDTWSRPEGAQRAVSLTRGLMGSALLRGHLEKRELCSPSFTPSFANRVLSAYMPSTVPGSEETEEARPKSLTGLLMSLVLLTDFYTDKNRRANE